MKALFLALGATRRRAVLEEAAQVLAKGGRVVVLIDSLSAWHSEFFPSGVDVVDIGKLEQRHLPRKLEALVLYRIPCGLLQVIGRGPLRELARRAIKSYRRRIADRVHRRLFLPLYRRVWSQKRAQIIERYVLRGVSFDVVVVSDPLSMPDAVRLLHYYEQLGVTPPKVTYSVDHATLVSS
ncbi:MAG TPA: hypothetical protein VF174_03280 [Micromonosporaceae bacterium]